jgi:pimeloyl-ACP methyl ester carboxylesterase
LAFPGGHEHPGPAAAATAVTCPAAVGALSQDFTVVVPDRRGRGLSGPHGDRYGLAREVEDLQGCGRGDRGDVSISALVPTMRFDIRLVEEMADTAKDYASLDTRVLLLDGTKSPAYFGVALEELSAAIPHAQRITFSGLGHSGPDDDGDPPRVAEALRTFFSN